VNRFLGLWDIKYNSPTTVYAVPVPARREISD
jgi:hypothetical protein